MTVHPVRINKTISTVIPLEMRDMTDSYCQKTRNITEGDEYPQLTIYICMRNSRGLTHLKIIPVQHTNNNAQLGLVSIILVKLY